MSFVSVGIRCISGSSAVMAAQPKAAAKNPGMNVHLSMKASTVKPALNGQSLEDHKLVFKTNYRVMQVKNIAECSKRAFCNTFDLL